MTNMAIIAMQLNGIRASLVAALEQCDAIRAMMTDDESPRESAPPGKKALAEGEKLFATFGGAKVPPPQQHAGES